jgi:hypothetical protein
VLPGACSGAGPEELEPELGGAGAWDAGFWTCALRDSVNDRAGAASAVVFGVEARGRLGALGFTRRSPAVVRRFATGSGDLALVGRKAGSGDSSGELAA